MGTLPEVANFVAARAEQLIGGGPILTKDRPKGRSAMPRGLMSVLSVLSFVSRNIYKSLSFFFFSLF